jgi:hypothetical protein
MSNLGTSARKLSEQMGVGDGTIQWGRVGVFCLAVVLSQFVDSALTISALPGGRAGVAKVLGMSVVISERFLIQAVLILVAFRLLGHQLAAAAAAAITYGAFVFVYGYISAHIYYAATFAWRGASASFLFLVGLVLALRWVKPVWLGLGVGATAGYGVSWGVFELVNGLHGPSTLDLRFLLLSFLHGVLFAGTFAVGLHLVGTEEKRLSKGFFVGSCMGAMVFAVLGVSCAWAISADRPNLFLSAVFPMLYLSGVTMVLIYQMWKAIQDGRARTTPGKALGLLFVPVFNLYWVFQAFWGFAKDYNAYVDRHSLKLRKLPERLFLAYTVLAVTQVMFPVTFVVGLIMIWKICDAVNALPAPDVGTAVAPAVAA